MNTSKKKINKEKKVISNRNKRCEMCGGLLYFDGYDYVCSTCGHSQYII